MPQPAAARALVAPQELVLVLVLVLVEGGRVRHQHLVEVQPMQQPC